MTSHCDSLIKFDLFYCVFFSLVELDASKNQLAYIPSGLLMLPELAVLNLSYNLLRRLPGKRERREREGEREPL